MVLFAGDGAGSLARPGTALTANHDAIVFGVDFDLIARQSRQLRGEDELRGCLVQIDRWSPTGRIGADELSNLFVECEQIAQRIPSRERHGFDRSMIGPR
jgi:hypothetical protein